MIIKDNFEYEHSTGHKTFGDMLYCKCDQCGICFYVQKRSIKKQQKKTNSYKTFCLKCRCKQTIKEKPQCSKEFWDNDKKQKHADVIRNSEKHKKSRKILKVLFKGSGNPMFGKKMSEETRRKMSLSRTGKIGKNATAWKGGKFSIVRTVKEHLHTIKWFNRVIQRDCGKCMICGSRNNLDAHHIKPISIIIKELLKNKSFKDNDEMYNFLINNELLIDPQLKNGITLCRKCHTKIHINWGSHFSKVKNFNELKKYYEKNKKLLQRSTRKQTKNI